MSEELTHKFTYTIDEYLNAMEIWYRRDRPRLYFIASMFCVVVLSAFFTFPLFQAILSTFLFIVVVFVAAFVIRPQLLKRNFRQSHTWQAEQEFSFDQNGMKMETEFSTTELKWQIFQKVWDTKIAYLLFFEKRRFLIIPKRIFRGVDEQMSFEALIRASIPDTKLLSYGEE